MEGPKSVGTKSPYVVLVWMEQNVLGDDRKGRNITGNEGPPRTDFLA